MNDKGAARRSGLGWMGKNTNILTPTYGSWIFLGQLILDVALKPDKPLKKTCGIAPNVLMIARLAQLLPPM
ncbi:MAG: hypothetical protein CM1200mP3_15700 [Chloroflexota bacterium]|nr:MAG: hypothetical protein CM1200mP3_15700 [Chloroflexota bacterium]